MKDRKKFNEEKTAKRYADYHWKELVETDRISNIQGV
jgi:hypothetical protein